MKGIALNKLTIPIAKADPVSWYVNQFLAIISDHIAKPCPPCPSQRNLKFLLELIEMRGLEKFNLLFLFSGILSFFT